LGDERLTVAIERDPVQQSQDDSTAAAGGSLLGSLVIVARQHGIQLSIPQLVHDYQLEPGQPSVAQLLIIAEASGLRASGTRLRWSQLLKLGKALPAVVLLRNGSAMVLRDVSAGPELPRVVLQDPNAHEDAPLVLEEARFTAAWTGEVLLFKRHYSLGDENQPFGLRLIVGQLLRDRTDCSRHRHRRIFAGSTGADPYFVLAAARRPRPIITAASIHAWRCFAWRW
jgi:subfamily B ATP-binding cassette protein HlyB/CyaB